MFEDLNTTDLDKPLHLEIMRVGTWRCFEITPRTLEQLVRNFIDYVSVDEIHNGCSGWIKALWQNGEFLWAAVELTKPISERLKSFAERAPLKLRLSPVIQTNWKHPVTGEVGIRLISATLEYADPFESMASSVRFEQETRIAELLFGATQEARPEGMTVPATQAGPVVQESEAQVAPEPPTTSAAPAK